MAPRENPTTQYRLSQTLDKNPQWIQKLRLLDLLRYRASWWARRRCYGPCIRPCLRCPWGNGIQGSQDAACQKPMGSLELQREVLGWRQAILDSRTQKSFWLWAHCQERQRRILDRDAYFLPAIREHLHQLEPRSPDLQEILFRYVEGRGHGQLRPHSEEQPLVPNPTPGQHVPRPPIGNPGSSLKTSDHSNRWDLRGHRQFRRLHRPSRLQGCATEQKNYRPRFLPPSLSLSLRIDPYGQTYEPGPFRVCQHRKAFKPRPRLIRKIKEFIFQNRRILLGQFQLPETRLEIQVQINPRHPPQHF